MFKDRLRMARKEKNMTLEDLSNAYNSRFNGKLAKGTLSKYENGKQEPMISVVYNLSTILGVSVDYLLGKDDYSFNESLFKIGKKSFPVLGSIACGCPIEAMESRESYVKSGTNIEADFCLIAKGDSMINARIMDGDIVFIRKQSIVDNGDIAVVLIDNEATLKRIFFYPNKNTLILKAENPKYPDFIFTGEELKDIRILGKAVAFQSDVV